MIRSISVIILFVLVASSCSYDKDEALTNPGSCDGVITSYSGVVKGLIETRCATGTSCHGAGSFNGPGALTTYQQVKAAAGNIRTAVHSGFMPQDSKLSSQQIKSITCWIDNGAPND